MNSVPRATWGLALLSFCLSAAACKKPRDREPPARALVVRAAPGGAEVTWQHDDDISVYQVMASSTLPVSADNYALAVEITADEHACTLVDDVIDRCSTVLRDLPEPGPWYVSVADLAGSEPSLSFGAVTVPALPRGAAALVPHDDSQFFQTLLIDDSGDLSDTFGRRLTVLDADADGTDELLVGAASLGPDGGYAALYDGVPEVGIADTDTLRFRGAQALGWSALTADMNGNGLLDLVLSEPTSPTPDGQGGIALNGRMYVYLDGSVDDALRVENFESCSCELGYSMARFPGHTTDGAEAIVAGMPSYNGATQEGQLKAFALYFDTTWGETWLAPGSTPDARLGDQVLAVDLTGEGFLDLIAGAPADGFTTGQVLVYTAVVQGGSTQPILTLDGPVGFGATIATGDFDGDGVPELAVGSGFTANQVDVFGVTSTQPLQLDPVWAPDPLPSGRIGDTVAAGDVNDDGYDDLVLRWDNNPPAVLLYTGGDGGLTSTPVASFGGVQDEFGLALALGRFSGAGMDIVIGESDLLGAPLQPVVTVAHGAVSRGPRLEVPPRLTGNAGAELALPDATFTSLPHGGTYQCSIDWGDGTTPTDLPGCTPNTRLAANHVYGAGGRYQVTVSVRVATYPGHPPGVMVSSAGAFFAEID